MTTNGEVLLQSPFLYAQAAGSDFSDFSSRGIHLRWQLRGILGETHLPKGDLAVPGAPYASTIGYNRPDDYVYLYKAWYQGEYRLDLDLLKSVPTRVEETGIVRKWWFDNYPIKGTDPLNPATADIELRFTDPGLYDNVRVQFSPFASTVNFLEAYKGILEVQVLNQLMYKADLIIQPNNNLVDYLEIEVICVPDLSGTGERFISCREIVTRNINQGEAVTVICDNIEFIRFRCSGSFAKRIQLVTYQATWLRFENEWQLIDKFSLSEDDAEVMARLENQTPLSTENMVDGQWPKYNDVDPATGAFAVSVPNYADRWTPALAPHKGIKTAVHQYLELSRTDLQAQGLNPSANTGDLAVGQFNYLDVLNILATDYHAARMLGLGHIDQRGTNADQFYPYIYCTVYETSAALGDEYPAAVRTHISITLPTRQTDYRYPPAPALLPVTYGLNSLNGSAEVTQLTLPGGYTPDGTARFVNISKSSFPHQRQRPMENFFSSPELFCMCDQTIPILYGLEYRHESEPGYRKPEILHDGFYFDAAGLPETLPIPEQNESGKPIFTHHETEEGIHNYALYSINWFSRVSRLSNEVSTDLTRFARRGPLPPLNLMTQLIQKEKARVFTTSPEQAMLINITDPDKSLARVTFEWNQVHNDGYQFADEVHFLMRKQPPLIVKGKVTNVQELPNNLARISTGPYTISSTNPAQIVQPNVPAALVDSFTGGILAAGQYLFDIESISISGNNPSFTIKRILQRTSIENPADPGSYLISETFRSPQVNDLFTANQNLSRPAQWDAVLDKKVVLEKFFPLTLTGSSDISNNKAYTVLKVMDAGTGTEITVKENIPNTGAATPGNIFYKKYIKYFKTVHSLKSILIEENLSAELVVGDIITIIAAGGNSGVYTISEVNSGDHFCRIVFSQPLPDTNVKAGVLVIDKIKAVSSFGVDKLVISGQNLRGELIPAYREFHLTGEGTSVHEFVIGGIQDDAGIASRPDPATGSASGVYEVILNNFKLSAPKDAEIEWYKGSIRIEEDPARFPASNAADYRSPEIKVLQIWSMDITGIHTKLIAYDPTFNAASPMSHPKSDYMPIRTGNNIAVNVHPGYRLYLTRANANNSGTNPFRATDLLPGPGEGTRQTLLAAGSVDTLSARESGLTSPVVLLGRELLTPMPPGVPTGPVFATRPDVYGKSTYTFDMAINTSGGRQPYAVVCYRAGIRKVLETLYLPETVQTILHDLSTLPVPDIAFFNDRFHDLVNVNYDTGSNQFRNYITDGYRFPVPDNNKYVIPNSNRDIADKPFNGNRNFGQNFTVTHFLNLDKTPVTESQPMQQIIKDAIDGAFLSLTEQPVLFRYVKDGRVTSPAKPKIRDSNGDRIVPGNPIDFSVFDPFPMAVKYVDNSQVKMRFTDYTLDGAANTFYFYYAVELNNMLEVSDRSPVSHPISLVNTMPAEAPAIKEIISIPADMVNDKGPRVSFRINNFIESEKIKRIRIYRATNHRDAVSVRNMTLASELALAEPLIDDFHNTTDLPYGEPLFYRIVALREIINEQGVPEYVPSRPSEISLTNIIDEINPPAPELTFISDPYAPTDTQMTNIVLSWQKTVHNGEYILFKLNNSGNWVKLNPDPIKTNNSTIEVSLSGTLLASGNLDKFNADNHKIYHHFKVTAVNSSNLLSMDEKILTI